MFDTGQYVEITLVPNNLRLAGTIRHTDGQHLLIAVSPSDSALLQIGMAVHLVQSSLAGMYQLETRVMNCREGLFVVKRERPQLLQRRRSVRLQCDLEGLCWRDYALEDDLADKKTESDPVIICDISLGGAQVLSKVILCKGQLLTLAINFTPSERIMAEVSVVRCGLLETPDPQHPNHRYRVATQFTRVSRINQVQIQRFLLQQAQAAGDE